MSVAWPTGGVGAIVLYSLFEEQLRQRAVRTAQLVDSTAESFPEALGYFPDIAMDDPGPRQYLSLIERAAGAVTIPLIGSLNGVTPEGWTGYARAMQDAGAAAIELNIYVPSRRSHYRRTGRGATPSRGVAASQSGGLRPGRRQAEPLLQLVRRDGPPSRPGRRRRARPLQSFPAARYRCRTLCRSLPM